MPLPLRVGLSALLLAAVGGLDDLTGGELSFSVFYLIPVLVAGVLISRTAGRVTALVGAAVWGYLEVAERLYSAAWVPIWNSGVRLVFFLVINDLVHLALAAHAREREFSRLDSLTGIANGRVFSERVEQVIAQSRRDGRSFTVAYADLDHFKQVNDSLGHSEGDALLRRVAETMSSELRAVDLVARLGGDEFGVLLTATDADGARKTLARIVESIRGAVGERWGVGVTLGAVTFLQPPDDVDQALKAADNLMYEGKARERGTIVHVVWPGDSSGSPGALRAALPGRPSSKPAAPGRGTPSCAPPSGR